jgi:Spy/CpxP family protein refolding chaperone
MKRYVIVCAILALGAWTPAFAQAPASKFSETPQVKGAAPGLKAANSGAWWREPEMVSSLNLSAEQQRKMDDIFQQYRLRLVDLNANLQKQEMMLEPMIETVRPGDDARVLAQIDRIAEARAELEKANARMLLAIRQTLTAEQWAKVSLSNTKEKAKTAAVELPTKFKTKEAVPEAPKAKKELAPEAPKAKKEAPEAAPKVKKVD